MKRMISLLLIITFIFTQMVFPAYAAESISFTVGSCDAFPGETVSIPISLSSNSGFVSMSLSVTYDTSALTLISYDDTGVIAGASHSSHFTSPYVLTWENDTLTSNITSTGTIVYLTFLVSEDAKEQDYSIIVRIPTDGILDAKGNTVTASSAMGTITVSAEHQCSFGDWEYYSKTKHVRYCDDCDEKEYKNHNWDDGDITKEPTHKDEGEIKYTCEDCGAAKTTEIDPEGHDYGKWTKHTATQHKRSCSCGDIEYEEHEWDDGETVKYPSSTEPGEIRYTCVDCGETYSEELPVTNPDHEHSYVVNKTVEVTCTTDGYTLYRCDGCGATKRENVVTATGHQYTDSIVAPTCTADGYTLHTCQNCNDSYKSNHTAKTGHNYVDSVCTYCKATTGDETPPFGDPDVYVAGDINGDGEVNDSDVVLLMQYYAGWQVNVNVKALDVNGDMHYNNKDVTRLIQYLAGWDVVIH